MDEWTKSKLERRNKGLEEQTFEEYKDDLKKQREEEEKEKEKKRKADRAAKTASTSTVPKVSASRKPSAQSSADTDDEDDDEDLKDLIKGYKKTSDGRTTSFFNNEMDEATKALYGDIGPKALVDGEGTGDASNSSPTVITSAGSNSTTGIAPSAWNTAGTFESRNITDWSTTHLKSLLEKVTYTLPPDSAGKPSALFGPVVVTARECKNVKGEAEIVISRGKKKVIYDLTAELNFEMTMDTSSATVTEKSFKGKITLTDITGDDEPDIAYSFKKEPSAEFKARATKAVQGFVEQVKVLCHKFKDDLLKQ